MVDARNECVKWKTSTQAIQHYQRPLLRKLPRLTAANKNEHLQQGRRTNKKTSDLPGEACISRLFKLVRYIHH